MLERMRGALLAARDRARSFLERAYVPEEPGRFRVGLDGLTPEGERDGLSPSCLALRIARALGLWDLVDKDEQAAWIAFICAHQMEPSADDATAGALLDPAVLEAARSYERPLSRWTRGWSREPDPLLDVARASTRRAVSALASVDVYAPAPYRALPTDPARLEAELKRSDWHQPLAAAARSADLLALTMSQGRHFLELTELHLLRETAARWFENLCDPRSGGFFLDPPPASAELLGAAAHVLDALDWLGRPPREPDRLIDTCLTAQPGRDCDAADWAHVLHHCLRYTHHRRAEVQASAPAALEALLAQCRSDGGWSLRPEGMATHDGPLEISDGRAAGDLFGTERFASAAAMLVALLEWDAPAWQVLRR